MRLGCAMLVLGMLCLTGPASAAPSDCVQSIESAAYSGPTTRYGHAVMGTDSEWDALAVTYLKTPECGRDFATIAVKLPRVLVFEDRAPILADLDGDGIAEILAIESHRDKGARLAVYAMDGTALKRIATTPHIGTRHRWMAQLGAADLDGDGKVEIAYVDRPHLARILRVWRFSGGKLAPVADLPGVTNHKFGEATIGGGIRNCGKGPEIIVASADWSRVLAVTLSDDALTARDIGAYHDRSLLTGVMECRK